VIGAGPVGVSKVLFARAGARVRRWRVARVMTVAGLLAVAALVTGCSGAGPDEVPTASGMPGGGVEPQVTPPSAPGALEVHCDENFVLTVSAQTVQATAAGVPLRVSSAAPAGTYLHYPAGGDELPAEPSVWMLEEPPGELALSCSSLDAEGADVVVTVVDPGGHWSDATAEDFGCAVGGMPGWAIEGGTGATPEEAVEELMGQFAEPMERAERAWVGYPDAAVQTWILGDERLTKVSAMVYEANGEYQASPDYICVETPWEETAFS